MLCPRHYDSLAQRHHPRDNGHVSTYHGAMTSDDDFLARIGRFNEARGGGILVERRQGGYTLTHEASGAPIARLRPIGRADTVSVLYWSHRGKWSQIGDFGGITLSLDDALAYVAENAIFWTWV
jgi:hypothetical protein